MFGRTPQTTRRGLASLMETIPLVWTAYGAAGVLNMRRFWKLLGMRFMPDEAFELGLFNPAVSDDALEGYFSKSALKHLQESLNPQSWAIIVEDKALFYRLCRAMGVAAPELYAVVYRSVPGWTREGLIPRGIRSWAEYLRKNLPARAVLKPSWGVYGREVMLLSSQGENFVDHGGQAWTAEGLVAKIFEDPADRGWILQERLVSHEGLCGLSGTDALQSFRIITLVGSCGASILHGHLKIIVGNNPVDNYGRGRTGNLQARIDLPRGVLRAAAILRKGGRGFEHVAAHPTSGCMIEGLAVPHWDQIRTFTLNLAEQFLPLQTVGWDVALTPDGPKVIEGNAWYDPPPVGQGGEVAGLVRALRKERKDAA
jgi:hypothetical protein